MYDESQAVSTAFDRPVRSTGESCSTEHSTQDKTSELRLAHILANGSDEPGKHVQYPYPERRKQLSGLLLAAKVTNRFGYGGGGTPYTMKEMTAEKMIVFKT